MINDIELNLSRKTVQDAILIIRTQFNLAHVTYNFFRYPTVGADNPWVRTTYPPPWVGHYFMRNLIAIDPVVRFGIIQSAPYEWATLKDEDGYDEVFDAAVEHGIGRNGYSIPIIDQYKRRALLSMTSTADDETWQAMMLAHSQTWMQLAHVVHKIAVGEAFGSVVEQPRLGKREIECLLWAARGKGTEETSTILTISQHTVRAYLKTARYKLDCSTISQAVATAIRLHLIEP